MIVYVVFLESGEYEGHHTEVDKIFLSEGKAFDYVGEMNKLDEEGFSYRYEDRELIEE